jgi:hypothetical protein
MEEEYLKRDIVSYIILLHSKIYPATTYSFFIFIFGCIEE